MGCRRRLCLSRNGTGRGNELASHELEMRMCWSLCVCVCVCVCTLSHVQLFCDPMDCSPPGSSAHGVFQARILEWVAISYSMGTSWPRDWTQVSCIIPPMWENLTQQNHQILVFESISFNLLPKAWVPRNILKNLGLEDNCGHLHI